MIFTAVAKMKFISIIGMLDKLWEVAELCGKTESFQPDDVNSFYSDTRNFFPISAKNEYTQILESFKGSLDIANIKRKIVSTDGFEPTLDELKEYCDKTGEKIEELISKKLMAEKDVERCRRLIEETRHFCGLNVALDKVFACEYIKANFGRLPKESFEKLEAYEENPFVTFFPCTVDDTHYWGVYISPIEESSNIDRIFSGLYFEHYEIEGMHGTPDEYNAQQKALLPDLERKLSTAQDELDRFTNENYSEILRYYSRLEQLNAYSTIASKACRYNNSFILVGWIPKELEKELSSSLSKIESVEFEITNGSNNKNHMPPVKLKNVFLARPFEFYTQMYGLPRYNEIDPTKFIALTYSILFGVMFGDVGHGILLLIAALIMWKVRKMPIGKILIPCSICSTVMGFVFGSVFGYEEVLNPVYKAFFGWEEKPIHVMRAQDTNTIIYSAVGLGMLLVLVAMCLNIYSCFKRGQIGQALFGVNGIAGFIFYGSLAVGLVCQMMLSIPVFSPAYIIALIVIPFIFVFLNEPLSKLVAGDKNWQPKSWGGFIVENFFECFEVVLSYVTNTMSFLRVGAFVLVHAGMMEVVFVLAQMIGGTGYIITVVIGNIIVMALEALLVGIQVLRLEYYEMFSRFYVGDGKAFTPVKVNIEE